MLIISVTVIHCSQPEKNNRSNIVGVLVENNKFQYAISENNQFIFHDYETDKIIYSIDSLYSAKFEIDGETNFAYENDDGSIKIYDIDLHLIEKLDGTIRGRTDSSLVIVKYLMGHDPEMESKLKKIDELRKEYGDSADSSWSITKAVRRNTPTIIEGVILSTYPNKKEIIVKEVGAVIMIDEKFYFPVFDTLGNVGYYDLLLDKFRDVAEGDFIGDNGKLHKYTLIDSLSYRYDDFVIDYSDYKYEGIIFMECKYLRLKFRKMNNELYCLSKNNNEVILTDHQFNVIEKTEFIDKAEYRIFSIKENIEIGVKTSEQMDWILPGRNDSIYAQVEVNDSVFYEQYWYDSDSLNYRIANAENHYDSNVKTSLIKELADSYVDNPKRPLFLLEDDGFLFLNNELNVIFESEDALEKYDFNDSSILMLLREKYTDKKYLRLYSWKD